MANGANDPSTPDSWNKYAYVLGDPINNTDRHGLFLDAEACINDSDDSSCLAENGPTYGSGGGGDNGQGAPSPSCSISVATSGTPINQNFVGAFPSASPTNQLGAYTTVNQPGYPNVFDQGWYFAVQIQGTLMGDDTLADWTDTQTVSYSGPVTYNVPGSGNVSGTLNVPTQNDNPDPKAIYQGSGAFDWIDAPGLGLLSANGLGTVVGANITWNFTSTLRDGSASCSVNWALNLKVPYKRGTFKPVAPKRPTPPGRKRPL